MPLILKISKVKNMHELGIMYNVVETVVGIAKENQVEKIEKLVLQIGELSPVVPRFIEECYPAAIDGTILQDTKLEIEILPGNARCNHCGQVYNLLANKRVCPACNGEEWELLGGKEFMIKEILAC